MQPVRHVATSASWPMHCTQARGFGATLADIESVQSCGQWPVKSSLPIVCGRIAALVAPSHMLLTLLKFTTILQPIETTASDQDGLLDPA